MKLIWSMNGIPLLFLCFAFSTTFKAFSIATTTSQSLDKPPTTNAPSWRITASSTSSWGITASSTPSWSFRASSTPSWSFRASSTPFWSFRASSTPYPCMYGICNGTCCQSGPDEEFFDCANGQKINKSLVCNRENDCGDGSDELRCAPWPPKMTVLPKHKVEIYCRDENERKSGILTLECASVGHPTPRISWKKYDGHVPSKCQQFSKGGHGILTCPDFQQADQGAYSCVAENSVTLAESQPKSIAKCSNVISCSGFRVVNEEKIEHCLDCFCSGRTTHCSRLNSNRTVHKISFTESQSEIFAKEDGEVVFIPTKTHLAPNTTVRQSSQEITYCSLTENDLPETSLLKSFGRSIIIPMLSVKTDFLPKAPLLIIRGNGLSLVYTANLISPSKNNSVDVSIRFWPGNWHHLNKKPATRKDLMKVLSGIKNLFIRCEYEQGSIVDWADNATIALESSVITDYTDSVSYVEKCHCPAGYDGLSCETCAEGYKKKPQGESFICEKIFVPAPCKEGYVGVNCTSCDTAKGYQKIKDTCVKVSCHPDGSTSLLPNFFGFCTCRDGVEGSSCDRCKSGYFFLNKDTGCHKCWCSGVTSQCKSSKLFRTVISSVPVGGYNYSDGRNFWLLPSDFSGNRLTSYGGFLNYTMKYEPNIPKQKSQLTVELLSADDVTLSYAHTTVDTSLARTEKFWSVPLIETNWKKSDKSRVSRGEFLKVLSKIKAVYVESPYHLSSGQVALGSTLMSSASSVDDGDHEVASEVEHCDCPTGYTGLSCETCSEGYYKKRNGAMTMCIKCNCTYCDPEFGCSECPQLTYRDNPEYEKVPVCQPCPCQDTGVSCVKDDLNQIFCRCKPGFTGMHCEQPIPEEGNELTIKISPRKIKTRKADETIKFNCSVLTSEDMVLTAKAEQGISSQNLLKAAAAGSKTSTTLNGRELWKTFEVSVEPGLKSIECFVHDALGRLAGHAVAVVESVIKIQPVTITNCYSNKIDIKEGENEEIICEAVGSPKPMVNWYRMTNGSKTEKLDTANGVHSIQSASLSDNGTVYTCIAENSNGDKAVCSRVLLVRKKCDFINIFPSSVISEEGRNISLTCKTTAKSSVNWTKPGGYDRHRVTVKGGVLHINNATVADSGTYVCSAQGENGQINRTALVRVEERTEAPWVSIKENDKTLKVGESVEVHCLVRGKPTPTVTWRRLNGHLSGNVRAQGKTLTITKATPENAGIYSCTANSSAGNASSNIAIEVEYDDIRPGVQISPEKIEGYEGDLVNVSCLAIGYPRPNVTWSAPNSSLHPVASEKDGIILIEPNKSEKRVVSLKLSKHMDGLSIGCIAENRAGRNETRSQIKLYQASVEINGTVTPVPIGSHFELICDIDGDARWEKEGGFVGDECPIPNGILILSVQRQHNGTYICKEGSDVRKIVYFIVVGFVPKFSRATKSYMVLPARLKSTSGIHVEMTFRPESENGFILEKADSKFNIYLEHRKIHVGIHSRRGDSLDIALNKPIELGKWTSLVVVVRKNDCEVKVYNESMSVHEKKIENFSNFDASMDYAEDKFFLGGPPMTMRHTPRLLFRHHWHFGGCISRLIIDKVEFNIVKDSSYSFNVSLCERCSEEPNPCRGAGKCLDAPTQLGFTCVCPYDAQKQDKKTCPASCVNKGCETSLNLCRLLNPCKGPFAECINSGHKLLCHCPYGYSGITCEKALQYSFCSDGKGYVRLPSRLLKRRLGEPETIKMAFTLNKADGQLLWQGDAENYLSVSVHQGTLKYIYFNQNKKLQVQGANLAVGKKYVLEARRINNTVTLHINLPGGAEIFRDALRNSTDKVHTNRVTGDIYLGMKPNDVYLSGHHYGLVGCIHYVAFGDRKKINLPEEALELFSVATAQKERTSSRNRNEFYKNVTILTDNSSEYAEEDVSEEDSNNEVYDNEF